MVKRITVNGVGSAIADSLYNGIDFEGAAFGRYKSRTPGDGGLVPGKLVLTEDFEAFTGKPADRAVSEIVGDRPPDAFNLGGPCPVALLNAAQLTSGIDSKVSFYSTNGNDEAGAKLKGILERTPVDISNYLTVDAPAPVTFVLSDPNYHGGSGERTFVNGIQSAWHMVPGGLDDGFFEADIVLFGGTALVPRIHAELGDLARRGKVSGCITVVTTVYDFPNEKKYPAAPWPLGRSDDTYGFIDLLITDREEALRLSGRDTTETAAGILIEKGVSALVITNGARNVYCYSNGSLFAPTDKTLPVSHAIEDARKEGPVHGDTTGAGDNFAGGVLASMMKQLSNAGNGGDVRLNLLEACALGIASGDFACFYMGGTYLENAPGEKAAKIIPIVDGYIDENRELIYGR